MHRKYCVTAKPPDRIRQGSRWEVIGMDQKNSSLREKDRQVYLNGIRKFMVKGVPVYIGEEKAEEDGLDKLFSPPEGTFYMADFIMEESPNAGYIREDAVPMVRESGEDEEFCYSPSAGDRFLLKEIRFDPVYHS